MIALLAIVSEAYYFDGEFGTQIQTIEKLNPHGIVDPIDPTETFIMIVPYDEMEHISDILKISRKTLSVEDHWETIKEIEKIIKEG